jgi:D-alanyl-lipoteichoic acid acyltransferase DltB (MBOAT superfamily)
LLFNTAAFVVFLLVVLGAYWTLPSSRVRHPLLLLASLFFYGYWDYRFLPLIAYVIVVAFVVARLLQRGGVQRKAILTIGCLLQLGQLGVFKYTGFVLDSVRELTGLAGVELSPPTFDIVLPVGISFYTFQAVGYMVDVYRAPPAVGRSFVQVALYITFFPQLVAGPIVRASEFFPQLDTRARLTERDALVGLKLLIIGLIYKSVFADRIGPMIDPVFVEPAAFDQASRLWAMLGFYGQIYFDFAGYSTMAIGMSRLFAIRLPKNFDFPYRATSVSDFWRRWHISLSQWLRDYLYIPLGGGRGPRWFCYRNLLLTMLLGGLWHGASYNFVLWGALHGVALVSHKLWSERVPVGRLPNALERVRPIVGWLLTQAFVLLSWVPFRAPDFASCGELLAAFAGTGEFGDQVMKASAWLLLVPVAIDHLVLGERRLRRHSVPRHVWVTAFTIGLALALTLPFTRLDVKSFIYFQF